MYSKLNTKVLKFNPKDDKDKIILNHYLMRRVNINNMGKELEPGQFSITLNGVSNEVGVSKTKGQRLIKEFEELGIIKRIFKGNKTHKYSIYEYVIECKGNTISETNIETNTETNIETNTKSKKRKHITDFNDFKERDKEININFETDNEVEYETKSSPLEIYNKNINIKINNIHADVVAYLNEKCQKNFKPTTAKTKSFINARLREGFELEDFKKVIDIKSSQWMYNDMEKYLRPETLFSNKFEGYLNEKLLKNSQKNTDTKSDELWDIEFDYNIATSNKY